MGIGIDRTGQRFGSVVAIKCLDKRIHNSVVWLCICDCGKKVEISSALMKDRSFCSHGCNLKRDHVGERYGKITVLRRTEHRTHGQIIWECKCDCGTILLIPSGDLRDRVACKPCSSRKHGGCGTRAYKIWENMLSRCLNPNATGYSEYGGRGITVCDRWLDFSIFREDMGNPPEGLTIERLNNNGSYNRKNCIWASCHVQSRNKRSNHYLTDGEITLCLTDWSRRLDCSISAIQKRLIKGQTIGEIRKHFESLKGK